MRLAAVADLHCGRYPLEALHGLLQRAAADAEVLLSCGNLVDHGLPDEARILARELAMIGTPTVAVLGHHDVEAGRETEIVGILSEVGVAVLDGDAHRRRGIGIAGVKGFAGGFGAHALGAVGRRRLIKTFVHEAVEEALKLEAALSRLTDGPRVAMLHYSPIAARYRARRRRSIRSSARVGSKEPLNRFGVDMVFHATRTAAHRKGAPAPGSGVQCARPHARARLSGSIARPRRRARGPEGTVAAGGAGASAPAIADGMSDVARLATRLSSARSEEFYRDVLRRLNTARTPYLVGGT